MGATYEWRGGEGSVIGATAIGATAGVLMRETGGELRRAIGGVLGRATGGALMRATGGVLTRGALTGSTFVDGGGALGRAIVRGTGGALTRAIGGAGGALGLASDVMLGAIGGFAPVGRDRGGGRVLSRRASTGDAWGLTTPCAKLVFSRGSSVTAWGRATWDRGLGGLGGTGPIRPIGVPFTFTDDAAVFATGRETGGFARFGSVSSARALAIVASATR